MERRDTNGINIRKERTVCRRDRMSSITSGTQPDGGEAPPFQRLRTWSPSLGTRARAGTTNTLAGEQTEQMTRTTSLKMERERRRLHINAKRGIRVHGELRRRRLIIPRWYEDWRRGEDTTEPGSGEDCRCEDFTHRRLRHHHRYHLHRPSFSVNSR